MKGKELAVAIIILILLGGIVAFYFIKSKSKEEEQEECITDKDCAPANCCHATACILASEKPDCSSVYCTAMCEPNTLDCGQGNCACVEGKCGAIIE